MKNLNSLIISKYKKLENENNDLRNQLKILKDQFNESLKISSNLEKNNQSNQDLLEKIEKLEYEKEDLSKRLTISIKHSNDLEKENFNLILKLQKNDNKVENIIKKDHLLYKNSQIQVNDNILIILSKILNQKIENSFNLFEIISNLNEENINFKLINKKNLKKIKKLNEIINQFKSNNENFQNQLIEKNKLIEKNIIDLNDNQILIQNQELLINKFKIKNKELNNKNIEINTKDLEKNKNYENLIKENKKLNYI